MKNWIVLLLAVFSFATISAQHCVTDLVINAKNERGLTLKIDGRKYKLDRHTTVIRNVQPGVHKIKIYKRQRTGYWGNGSSSRVVSKGRLEVHPCSKIYARIHHGKGLHIDDVKHFYPNGHSSHYQNHPYGDNDHGHSPYNNNYGNPGNYSGQSSSGYSGGAGYDDYIGYGNAEPTPPPTCGNAPSSNYGGYNQPSGYDYYGQNQHISEARFNEFYHQLKNVTFESTRKNQAISIIKNNNLSSEQMRSLLGLFDFESTRLEIAKYGFENVTDPQNYNRVFQAFSFSSSVDEMVKFMNS